MDPPWQQLTGVNPTAARPVPDGAAADRSDTRLFVQATERNRPMPTTTRAKIGNDLTPTTTTPSTGAPAIIVDVPPPAPRAVTASIVADEVIAPGTAIELTFPAELDPRSAQGAIRIERRFDQPIARISLSKRNRVASGAPRCSSKRPTAMSRCCRR